MRGDPEIVALLNEQLASEWTAIHQFELHAAMQSAMGFDKLAARTCEDVNEERRHAQRLTSRILLLEGLPDFQRIFPLRVGRTVQDMFRNDMALELDVVDRLRAGIPMVASKGDITTASILGEILADEEEHVDHLEAQLSLIEQLGEQTYLARQISTT
jgi:bacterioferritin